MILETQPWLLALTVTISISHTVFEMLGERHLKNAKSKLFLAFKNDIQFWKTRENIQGLSIRAVLFNCFCQLIVLLYVCDNDTNFMVKVSIGVGLLIELWKVTKVDFLGLYWNLTGYEVYKSDKSCSRRSWLHGIQIQRKSLERRFGNIRIWQTCVQISWNGLFPSCGLVRDCFFGPDSVPF